MTSHISNPARRLHITPLSLGEGPGVRLFLSLFILSLFPIHAAAQQQEHFSIATLNVDGLPQKIWFATVNPDGPGSAGSVRIGQYLQKRCYDLIFVQEDFNYHEELTVLLENDYTFDTWSGDVGVDGHSIDLMHLQNHRFECDGLGAFWKNNITVTDTQRTPWEKTFGKFSHAADEMVTKGFRRYHVTLPGGSEIIVYNMHMDASSYIDEQEGKDTPDREARLSEWTQIRDDIMDHLDTRPVIVLGDLNSYYSRDHIKAQFIDIIESTGKATVHDAWVELQNNGQYPEPAEGIVCTDDPANMLNGETLDKIIYINPLSGTNIQAISFTIDQDEYIRDGKMLGDHFPLTATFSVSNRTVDGIDNTMSQEISREEDKRIYNLSGQRINQPATGVNIEVTGNTVRKRIIK